MSQLTELEILDHIDPSLLDYQERLSVGTVGGCRGILIWRNTGRRCSETNS